MYLRFIMNIVLNIYFFLTNRDIRISLSCKIYKNAVLDTPHGGAIRLGKNVQIHPYAMLLTYGGNIYIGENSGINPYCMIYGHGNLSIGESVKIAAHTIVIPANHIYEKKDILISEQGMSAKGIVIEKDVWIGAGSKLLDGIKIGKGCVIGAGSVVTKNTEPYGVYVGVPATKISERN